MTYLDRAFESDSSILQYLEVRSTRSQPPLPLAFSSVAVLRGKLVSDESLARNRKGRAADHRQTYPKSSCMRLTKARVSRDGIPTGGRLLQPVR